MLETRWESIAGEIRNDIESGRLKPGDRIPSETVLAERWQVARMTVHRAMRRLQEEGLIARRRGMGTIVADFRPQTTATIALVLREQDDTFGAGYASGVHRVLPEQCRLVVYSAPDVAREAQLLDQVSHETAGLICFPTSDPPNTPRLRALVESGFPLVCIDRVPDGLKADGVVTDNLGATVEAMREMINRGHSRIAYFGASNLHISSARERYDGYVQVMTEAGAGDFEALVRTFPPRPGWRHLLQATRDAIAAMTRSDRPITAAFAVNDQFLAAILEASDQLGIKVPDELELVSFCDYPPWTLRESDGINRIIQQTRLVGETALKRLMNRLANKALPIEVIRIPALFRPNGRH